LFEPSGFPQFAPLRFASEFMLTDQSIEPRDLPTHGSLLERIIDVANDHLKAEFHILLLKLVPLSDELREC
jgi:hypothetical protein